MALDFPSSPNTGATYTASGVTWVWDGAKWEPSAIASGPFVPLSGATMAGPLILSEDPKVPLESATKEYVDTAASGVIPANYPINSNRIINGDMRIDQRNNGAVGTANGYTLDRWYYFGTQAGKGNWRRNPNSAPIPPGFPYSLCFVSLSAYTALATDQFFFNHPIEADHVSDFMWGTSQAQPVTLSFWVSCTQTGTFSGSVGNYASTRSYPFTFSIPTANAWILIAITIPGDTGGTWVMSGNGGGVNVNFDLGSGANYRSAAGAWANGAFWGVTGGASVVATNNAQWFVTGVKLEIGSVATPFNRQTMAKSLADCQRYYENISPQIWSGATTSGSSYYYVVRFQTPKRADPTCTYSLSNSNAGFPASAPVGGTAGAPDCTQVYMTANGTAQSGYYQFTGTASAEL
jgi:hypothetical protein